MIVNLLPMLLALLAGRQAAPRAPAAFEQIVARATAQKSRNSEASMVRLRDGRILLAWQLADGKWHNILCFRICDGGEVLTGTRPAAQTGAYLEEVITRKEAFPTWYF